MRKQQWLGKQQRFTKKKTAVDWEKSAIMWVNHNDSAMVCETEIVQKLFYEKTGMVWMVG